MPDASSSPTLAALRDYLIQVAARGEPVTYRQACDALGLTPPGTIQRLARLLEASMADDAGAERPFLAALVVSQARERDGLPAPGFFEAAQHLGRFAGEAQGEAARRFHRQERDAALAYYR